MIKVMAQALNRYGFYMGFGHNLEQNTDQPKLLSMDWNLTFFATEEQ
jgi:hypothetical protein